jgi:transcription elongation factor GreA
MSSKKFYLTTQGRARFENELLTLENYARTVAGKLRRSFSRDRPKENGDLEIAQSEMDYAESRIEEVAYILENSETIAKPRKHQAVVLGSKVHVRCVGAGCDKKLSVYEIVGSLESDPETGKISDESPLGMALTSKQVGETVIVMTPKGEANYQILKIE